jgi:hypothetical protein
MLRLWMGHLNDPERLKALVAAHIANVELQLRRAELHADHTDDEPAWSFPRMMFNLPLIGATTFHLFTSYPIQPDWIVRHRRIQVLPYIAALTRLPRDFGSHVRSDAGHGRSLRSPTRSGSSWSAHHRRHRAPPASRGPCAITTSSSSVLVSFSPALGARRGALFATPFLFYFRCSVFVFPALSHGILRRQLFEVRSLAKSLVAYGAVARHHGRSRSRSPSGYAVARFGVSERPAQIALLFVAILPSIPATACRAFVDRFFDRTSA